MRWITYEECEHVYQYWSAESGGARYAIDWETPDERKYKTPIYNVRVYENGPIVVLFNGDGDPVWRYNVRQLLDLDFRNSHTEMIGYGFYDPETGEKVPRKNLPRTQYLFDEKTMRIYNLQRNWLASDRHMNYVKFYSPDAVPVSYRALKFTGRDIAAENDTLEKLNDAIALGTTLNELSQSSCMPVAKAVKHLLGAAPLNLTDSFIQDCCRYVATAPKRIIQAHHEKIIERPFLDVRTRT